MRPKDADGMANSVDPDQTVGAVESVYTLFAQNLSVKKPYHKNPKNTASSGAV